MSQIMVSVCCIVFNQERYIRKCLESLVMQETNFKYEIVVHDDASTDRSADIIREFQQAYPDKVVPLYETENQYSKGNAPTLLTVSQAHGKYIALCEGDDFWTSPHKLQKQVDFLESHEDFSLCVHAAYCAHEDDSLFSKKFFRPYAESREVSVSEMLESWKFATNSVVYRRSAQQDLIPPFRGDCHNGDYAMTAYLALHGRVYYIDELMSAYRVESIGSMNWVWETNVDRNIAAQKKFLQMLDRIDAYSDYQYSDALKKAKQRTIFNINVLAGNRKEAKKDIGHYAALSARQKFELWLHCYFPGIFFPYRNIIKGIKRAKYHF